MIQETMARAANREASWQARFRRESLDGREWLHLDVTSAGGGVAHAWAPYSDLLREALEAMPAMTSVADRPLSSRTASTIPARERELAEGLVASAGALLVSGQHGRSLHSWMGGPVRRDVRVAWPLTLTTRERAERVEEIAREATQAIEAVRRYGIGAFVIHDASTDVETIATAVSAMRQAVGPSPALSLRLVGQLDVRNASRLFDLIRPANLVSVTDPCPSIDACVAAGSGHLPALGLSADGYDRSALLECLSLTPPAVLVVDPLLEGGPYAVRRLGAVARVLQTNISLSAEGGGVWLVRLCAELASVVPAASQPIELPTGLSLEALRELGLADGVLCPPSWPTSVGGVPGLTRGVDDSATSRIRT